MEKSLDRWVEEAKALLDMGARMVDAATVRALLTRIDLLQARVESSKIGQLAQRTQEEVKAATVSAEEWAHFLAQLADAERKIDRLVDMGVKAAEGRINEVYAQQQKLVQDAFEAGKRAGTKKCAEFLEGMADSLQMEGVTAAVALKKAAEDLLCGEHDKEAVYHE